MEKKYTQITIKGITILMVAALIFYVGYRYGRGEVDRKQILVEHAELKNQQLSSEKEELESIVTELRSDNLERLKEWHSRFEKMKQNKIVPPSECQGEDDMYGTDFSNEFQDRQRKQREAMIDG